MITMSSISRFTAAALTLLAANALAEGFDAETYHGSNCTRCHDTGVYTREDRKISSYPMLESRVRACDANFGEKLPPEGLSSLIDHLNNSYYKFTR